MSYFLIAPIVTLLTKYSTVLAIFIFYSKWTNILGLQDFTLGSASKHKDSRFCQFALLLTSFLSGTRMIFLVNRGSYLKVMRQVCDRI